MSTLEVAIYDFRLTDPQLAATVVGALTGAAKRGVTVRLAYDAGKPTAGTTTMFARLAADPAPPGTAQWVANNFGNSDVQIHAITAPSGQLMHSKFVVRDGLKLASTSAVWTGSTNSDRRRVDVAREQHHHRQLTGGGGGVSDRF